MLSTLGSNPSHLLLFAKMASRTSRALRTILTLLFWIVASSSSLICGQEASDALGSRRLRHSEPRAAQATMPAKVGKINKLCWINADTNKAISIGGSKCITGNAWWIDEIDVPKHSLTLQAVTNNDPVGSIQFEHLGGSSAAAPFVHVANSAPWAFCGRKDGSSSDYLPCPRVKTEGPLVAMPYSGKNATGTAGEVFEIYLAIFNSSAPELSFTFINADTDQDDATMTDDLRVDLSRTPRISIRLDWQIQASRSWEPARVKFNYDNGTYVRTERYAPFALAGDVGGTNYLPFTPTVGRHTVKATVYRRQGVVGAEVSTTFTVVSGSGSF